MAAARSDIRIPTLDYDTPTSRVTRWRVRWGWVTIVLTIVAFVGGAVFRAGARDYRLAVRAAPQQNYANVHIIAFTNGRIGVASFGPGVVDVATGRPLRITNVTFVVQAQPSTCLPR